LKTSVLSLAQTTDLDVDKVYYTAWLTLYAMPSLLQSSIGLLKSRLSRRIVSWIFLSIITIEFIIFIPAYGRRRGDELQELETVSQEVLFTIKSNVMAEMTPQLLLSSSQAQIRPGSVILGAILYDTQGNVVDAFGERPTLPFSSQAQAVGAEQLVDQGTRYDVAWPSRQFQDQYVVVIRHDATGVKRYMVQYAIAIAGLVTIISAFVTLVTILVLERLLINPLLYLRDDLLVAAEAIKQDLPPNFRSLAQPRKDELGDVAQAFGAMFQRIAQEIHERKQAEIALRTEQEKSDRLLENVLPVAIANRLKNDLTNRGAIASRFEDVTILFADIVGFTTLAAQIEPTDLVCQLNTIFSAFDNIAEELGLEKIKTIGDAYMVVGGVPDPRSDHAEAILQMALRMQAAIAEFRGQDDQCFHLRIGIHTGPVVAGVIGLKKFSYDLWGDTVNIASRMESHGVTDQIQVSAATYERLKGQFEFCDRGTIELKGRGQMQAYLVARCE
jgi:adenylate cyclase